MCPTPGSLLIRGANP